MAIVSQTDRPKPVRNRCVIQVFGSIFVLDTLFFCILYGSGGFCHRNESDISLFSSNIFDYINAGDKVCREVTTNTSLRERLFSVEDSPRYELNGLKRRPRSFKLPFYYVAIFFNIGFLLIQFLRRMNVMLDFIQMRNVKQQGTRLKRKKSKWKILGHNGIRTNNHNMQKLQNMQNTTKYLSWAGVKRLYIGLWH